MNVDAQLTLHRAPAVLFFYGIAGSGKSFVAKLLSERSDYFLYEADNDISPEMKLALAEHRPFTDAMRDEFFTRIAEKINHLKLSYSKIVVSQAVYKHKHRVYLQQHITNMDLICVQASDGHLLERIRGRGKGISLESAAALRADFEQPAYDDKTIVNESDQTAVIQQLNKLYSH